MNIDADRFFELLMMEEETNQMRRRGRKSVQFHGFLEEISFEEMPDEDSKKKQNWYTVSTDIFCAVKWTQQIL
jgi:hypothetical protein